MRQTILVVLTLFLLSIGAHLYAGHAAKAEEDRSAEAELIALDDAWIDAEVGQDRAALERILHEDFVAVLKSGRTIDRNTFLEMIMNADLAPFTVTHEVIRVHGDTAVVIDLSEDGETKFTWIAIKREGQWRVVSETISRVEPR